MAKSHRRKKGLEHLRAEQQMRRDSKKLKAAPMVQILQEEAQVELEAAGQPNIPEPTI